MPTCFVLSPAAPAGSEVRRRADELFERVVRPAAESAGYRVYRRRDSGPEAITDRLIHRVTEADLVIADLAGADPGVCYALAVRHALDRPAIHLTPREEGVLIDLWGFETIEVAPDDAGYRDARARLEREIRALDDEPRRSPLAGFLDAGSVRRSPVKEAAKEAVKEARDEAAGWLGVGDSKGAADDPGSGSTRGYDLDYGAGEVAATVGGDDAAHESKQRRRAQGVPAIPIGGREERSGDPEAPAEAEDGPRYVNTWFEGDEPVLPLVAGRRYEFKLAIGARRERDGVEATVFVEPDFAHHQNVDLLISLYSEDFEIETPSHQLCLWKDADSDTVATGVTPRRPGRAEIRVVISLYRELEVLQRLSVGVDVVAEDAGDGGADG